ncbi:MAG: hypothetical protein CMM91_10860 [Rickettsiales bacterium]|nr:hypothetical protein [Rickettsiales bacterium]OUV52965.1 MAG: hypothetical protein CBC87_06345 [Rickettsiales bacterium TMED127]|tara:strand:+ start:63495 stop:64610 length:1116 start_codon:yes stop_codon:yes gene_type:complete
MKSFDIIIIGSGLSGLSLTIELLKKTDKTVLILEKKKKLVRDKNFCFWNSPKNSFTNQCDTIWKKIKIKEQDRTIIKSHKDFYYCHLSSSTFYNNCLNTIKKNKNVSILFNQKIKSVISKKNHVIVDSNNKAFSSNLLFDSRPKKFVKYKLLQHFYGIEVTSKSNIFDENEVTLMDLKPDKMKTHFFYILPFTKNKALIESTYFSNNIYPKKKYKFEIFNYLKKNYPGEVFKLGFEEYGVIPMHKIPESVSKCSKIINIGTSANWIRMSTGYSFQNSFINSQILVNKIIKKKKIKIEEKKITNFLDNIFCIFLSNFPEKTNVTFFNFFLKNKLDTIVRFLTDSYTYKDMFKIIFSLPKKELIYCAFKYIIK